MSDCTRQEKILQSINKVQKALDEVVTEIMNNQTSLVQMKNNPMLLKLIKNVEYNTAVFRKEFDLTIND